MLISRSYHLKIYVSRYRWQATLVALCSHCRPFVPRSNRSRSNHGEDVSDVPLAELLDGCMRAVHEGLGDQNVRVYAEACMAVTATSLLRGWSKMG